MAHLEVRLFRNVRYLLVVADTPKDCLMIDSVLGTNLPIQVRGEALLADGYGELYIRLKKV